MDKYKGSTILIVDDEVANIFFLKGVLTGEGYKVVTASNGYEALEYMKKECPDSVLLDAMMSDINGLTVLKAMQDNENLKDIPVIMVTARTENSYLEECLNVGATDYIKKPIDDIELLARLRASLRLSMKIKELKSSKTELEELNERLEYLSERDSLTGLYNRRSLDSYAEEMWKSCYRENRFFSVIMLDVDLFKKYNDLYGHQIGDECLKIIARVTEENLNRPTDFIARYGGEEFLVILPETDENGALFVAENIRKSIEAAGIKHELSTKNKVVTISIGLTSAIPTDKFTLSSYIKKADDALYISKKNGRNMVTVIK